MRCRQSRQIPAATLPRTLAACLSDDRFHLQREPTALVLVAAAGAVHGRLGVRQAPLPTSRLSARPLDSQTGRHITVVVHGSQSGHGLDLLTKPGQRWSRPMVSIA